MTATTLLTGSSTVASARVSRLWGWVVCEPTFAGYRQIMPAEGLVFDTEREALVATQSGGVVRRALREP